MKRVALCLTLLFSSSVMGLEINHGWNLIGLSKPSSVDELKSLNRGIEKVFIYKDGTYVESGNIDLAQGVWIKSSTQFELIEANKDVVREAGVDKIVLQSGWNLISVPTNNTISPKIFDARVVYKYKNGSWSGYSQENLIPPELSSLDTISNGEGFWVYVTNPVEIELTKEESKLSPFVSKEEMDRFLESMVNYNKSYKSDQKWDSGIYYPMTPPTTGAEGDFSSTSSSGTPQINNATTTNLQELGVDEADIIKHDNVNLFYIPQVYDGNESKIYATTFSKLLSGDSQPLSTIVLASRPNEMYLIDSKLIVIFPYNNNFWGYWGAVDFGVWSEKSKVEIYDVSNIASIRKTESFEMDGNIVDSRITNNTLYVVSRYMPYFKVEYAKEYITDCDPSFHYYYGGDLSSIASSQVLTTPSAMPYYDGNYCIYYAKDENGYYKYNYENVEIKEAFLYPSITSSKGSENFLSYAKTYAPGRVDQNPFITTISAFKLEDLSRESLSIIGDSSTLYASTNSIYLVSEKYPLYYSFSDYKTRSIVYKFGIKNNLTYEGNGLIDGKILNQFSLSESGDILRIATTDGWSWNDTTNNMLFNLKVDNGELKEEGSLKNLGKEGETIRGVRFLGDRGFIVTFKQTDPLYTLDLSDPKNPKKVGELIINGYSSYFHPVSENFIMSVGMNADDTGRESGVMLQLFDISDFANPTLRDKVVFQTNTQEYYYSEAVNNHKAFTFRDSDKLFSLPISYSLYNYSRSYLNYLSLFKIEGNGFRKIRDINSNATSYMSGGQRGVIFTKDSKDYAIYFDGENLNLGEITQY